MKTLEYKEFGEVIRDVDVKKRIVSGYLSQVEVSDKVMDIVDKKAFNMTLSERKNDIYYLNQHNWSQPHGKFSELEVDNYGLKFISNPFPNTSYSNDAIELIEKGIINSNSIGYITMKSQKEGQYRRLTEVKLMEGSTVTLPANDGAVITGLKSMNLDQIREKEVLIIKAFRTGKFTDETFTLLELALKELQMQSYELGKKDALNQSEQPAEDKSNLDEVKQLFKNFKI